VSLRLAKADTPAHGKTHVVRAFLLQPDVPRMVVGQLDDERARRLRQRRGDPFDELLLAGDVDRSKQLVLMNRLQQFFVLVFALLLGIREGWDVPSLAFEFELRGATIRQFEQLI